MKCSLCGKILQLDPPYDPFIIWKGKVVGECCYDRLLHSLKAESLVGDPSFTYDFDGVFLDDDNVRYHISQEVVAGPGNMGFSRNLTIKKQ